MKIDLDALWKNALTSRTNLEIETLVECDAPTLYHVVAKSQQLAQRARKRRMRENSEMIVKQQHQRIHQRQIRRHRPSAQSPEIGEMLFTERQVSPRDPNGRDNGAALEPASWQN